MPLPIMPMGAISQSSTRVGTWSVSERPSVEPANSTPASSEGPAIDRDMGKGLGSSSY